MGGREGVEGRDEEGGAAGGGGVQAGLLLVVGSRPGHLDVSLQLKRWRRRRNRLVNPHNC